VIRKVLLGSKEVAPPPHNLSLQKPLLFFLSDSDIRLRMLKFSQQCALHDVKFTSSSVERVEHVAMLVRASRLVLTVKAEAVTQKVSPAPVNPSGDPQAKNIPARRSLCRIVKPIAKVRKNTPFARTFLLRLEEKGHYSDPTFVRTILFPSEENVVYLVKAMDQAKPLLEVKRILQRVGPTNLRGVVATQHLGLGQSNDTLVLPTSIPVVDLSPNAMVSISGALSPIHIAKQLASAAKRDPDCLENTTGQHPVTEVSALHNDPQCGGVLSHGEQQGIAWKACRKAAKRERRREIQLAERHCESRVNPIKQESGKLDNGHTTSRWPIGLKKIKITETEWTCIRNHLRSTSPEFFRRIKKGDAVVGCDSLKYTAQNYQPAALAFLIVTVRNGMPEQRLIDKVHMIRVTVQARESEATIAREEALVQLAESVKDEGDIGHAPRAGSGRSNLRLGNHKERRFHRSKRLEAQAQTDAKRQRRQPGFKARACVPDD